MGRWFDSVQEPGWNKCPALPQRKRHPCAFSMTSRVSYTPLTEEEVFQHMSAVAEAGDLPLCIYNNPDTTRFFFSDSLIARLAKVPGIAAIKMPLPAEALALTRAAVAGDMEEADSLGVCRVAPPRPILPLCPVDILRVEAALESLGIEPPDTPQMPEAMLRPASNHFRYAFGRVVHVDMDKERPE